MGARGPRSGLRGRSRRAGARPASGRAATIRTCRARVARQAAVKRNASGRAVGLAGTSGTPGRNRPVATSRSAPQPAATRRNQPQRAATSHNQPQTAATRRNQPQPAATSHNPPQPAATRRILPQPAADGPHHEVLVHGRQRVPAERGQARHELLKGLEGLRVRRELDLQLVQPHKVRREGRVVERVEPAARTRARLSARDDDDDFATTMTSRARPRPAPSGGMAHAPKDPGGVCVRACVHVRKGERGDGEAKRESKAGLGGEAVSEAGENE